MIKNIPVAEPDLSGNEMKYITDCVQSSWISSKGEYIELFEKGFARFVGTKYAVSTSNGTTALHLALHALGIGKNDEVIVPDLTFIATANTVIYTGAKPVVVDVERNTWNIDPTDIIKKITKRTKAIIVVHLYGHPANMEKIEEIAQKYHLLIIEDAAEAHGAEIRMKNIESGIKNREYIWKKVGSIGKVGCFSFYGNKIITCGEGGMVTTNDEMLVKKMKILRDHGQTPNRRYFHEVIGFNYRMTNVQAAIGLAQLERINQFIEKKRQIAFKYSSQLKKIKGITVPPSENWAKSVFWMYSLLIDKPFPLNRDQVMQLFEKHGIETRPFFIPLHKMPPYKRNNIYPI